MRIPLEEKKGRVAGPGVSLEVDNLMSQEIEVLSGSGHRDVMF